jgi:hypothetical protein
MFVKVGVTYECLEHCVRDDGSSHAEVTAGAEILEKLQMFSVSEVALLTTGRESCRDFAVPK